MQLLLQQIVDGLGSGVIYASLALALVLVYRATRIVNFAQGEMGTFSAYVAWQLMQWGVPVGWAVAAVAVFAFALGAAVFRLVVRPLIRAPEEIVVVVTIGLFVVVEALAQWLWGFDQRAFPRLFPDHAWNVGDIRLTANTLGLLAVLALLAVGLTALLRFTRLGLAMRAAAAERDNSPLVGIEVETMLTLGWGLSAMVGFLAAALVAPRLFLSPDMMVSVLIYSLAAATLGGWDSLAGAIVAGLLMGVAENLGATFVGFIGSELRLAIPIALTLVVLLLRPAGLFGRATVLRV
jgi:branched-chain amino acid transport system permease protein